MKWILTISAAICIVLTGCSSDAREEFGDNMQGPLTKQHFEFADFGLPLKMKLPEEMIGDQAPEIQYNSSFGQVEVILGERMHFSLSQDDLTIRQMKSDLNSDQLFSYKFLECGEDQLFYQAVLPTGEAYYFHFAASLLLGGERYLLRTDPIGEYTKSDIELLMEAVNTIELIRQKPVEGEEV
ncbi:hypothetical protein [Halocola ammonii]